MPLAFALVLNLALHYCQMNDQKNGLPFEFHAAHAAN